MSSDLITRVGVVLLVANVVACAPASYNTYKHLLSEELRPSPPTSDTSPQELTLSAPLDRDQLIREVLKRNPNIDVAAHAIQRQLAKYPQTIAFKDLSFGYDIVPGSIGPGRKFVNGVRISQSFEWPGKQELRGESVLFSAKSGRENFEALKLKLQTAASNLFDDYFVAQKGIELNREHHVIVQRLHESALAHYSSGHGAQQDPIQAELALAKLDKDLVKLETRRRDIAIQINGLLNLPPETPLPDPPSTLPLAPMLEGVSDNDYNVTIDSHPELRARQYAIDARRVDVELAKKGYYPDFGISISYSSMRPDIAQQFGVGFVVNLPTQWGARDAKVDESTAALAESISGYQVALEGLKVEFQRAVVRQKEAEKEAKLYEAQILPIAKRRIEAAEAAYISNRTPFYDVLQAQQQLETFQREYADAISETWRRRAKLKELLSRSISNTYSSNTEKLPQDANRGGLE